MLFGAVWLRAVPTVPLHCSCSLGELEPLHREKWSGSRLYNVWSCSAQSCSCPLRELEQLDKETVLYFVPYH